MLLNLFFDFKNALIVEMFNVEMTATDHMYFAIDTSVVMITMLLIVVSLLCMYIHIYLCHEYYMIIIIKNSMVYQILE